MALHVKNYTLVINNVLYKHKYLLEDTEPRYRHPRVREASWLTVADEVNEKMGTNEITVTDIQYTWENLCNAYMDCWSSKMEAFFPYGNCVNRNRIPEEYHKKRKTDNEPKELKEGRWKRLSIAFVLNVTILVFLGHLWVEGFFKSERLPTGCDSWCLISITTMYLATELLSLLYQTVSIWNGMAGDVVDCISSFGKTQDLMYSVIFALQVLEDYFDLSFITQEVPFESEVFFLVNGLAFAVFALFTLLQKAECPYEEGFISETMKPKLKGITAATVAVFLTDGIAKTVILYIVWMILNTCIVYEYFDFSFDVSGRSFPKIDYIPVPTTSPFAVKFEKSFNQMEVQSKKDDLQRDTIEV